MSWPRKDGEALVKQNPRLLIIIVDFAKGLDGFGTNFFAPIAIGVVPLSRDTVYYGFGYVCQITIFRCFSSKIGKL